MAKRKGSEVLADYILWSYSSNNEGKHPVKIRITNLRKRKYYNILTNKNEKLFLKDKEFEFLSSTPIVKLRGENRELRAAMDGALAAATQAIQDATNNGKKSFLFSEFEKKYLGSDVSRNFLSYFQKHIKQMEKRGQAGNARTYQSAYSSLKQFLNEKDIDPSELTVKKLEAFDLWLRTPRSKNTTNNVKEGKKKKPTFTKPLNDTSVGIYMRCLRAVYNEIAIDDDYLKTIYPFSGNGGRDKKYLIPVGGGQKGETLDVGTINKFIEGKIEGAEAPDNPMYRAKLIFLFSFFGQGINPVDIAHLRYENITTSDIKFERRKTIRTRTEARVIEIPLIDQLKEILVALGNPNKDKREYVFNVLSADKKLTPKEEDDKIRQWVKVTNKWLKRYCKFNELLEFSLYSARHTFASIAKAHIPVAQISKMFGHRRITTTQNYLGRFDHDQNKKALHKVFDSLKESSTN